MLNTVYRLIAPRVFQPVEVDMPLDGTSVLVRPTHLSICNADMRYYQGARSAEALRKKLPMALIHEGIGRVVACADGSFEVGQRVVMLPNNPHETDPNRAENYLPTSGFCGSGHDGFMQELVVLPAHRLVAVPESVPDEVAAFTEIVSVAQHAITRFGHIAHAQREHIGIWGDGNLGFMVALLLRATYPQTNISVFGRNDYKLNDFTFVDNTYLVHSIPDDVRIDHAFECCGGDGSAAAIDQIIDYIKPEGTVSLLGVSENPVPVNTRMVLEKGLRLFGSSRSGREDFLATVALYEAHPEVPQYLQAMVNTVVEVNEYADIAAAFKADLRKSGGKTIMKWNI